MTITPSTKAPWIVAALAVVVLGWGWYQEAHQRRLDQQQTQSRQATLESSQRGPRPAIGDRDMTAGSSMEREAFAARVVAGLDSGSARGSGMGDARSQQEIDREKARRLALLEARFAADGSDPRWASGTETAATQAIVEPVLAPFGVPKADDVQCARTMCRMVFTFDSASQADDWAVYYPVTVGQQLPVSRTQQNTLPDGSVELRIYGFRDPKAKPFN